jgi:autotransporter-associated beta strand protein
LGDASTATGDNIRLAIGGAFEVGRILNVGQNITASPYTGTISIGGNADATATFSGGIMLYKNLTVTQAATTGTNALNITNDIWTANSGNNTVTFAGPGAINKSGQGIGNGVSGGTTAVAVTGGTLTMSAANTYAGGTSVTGGTLVLDMAVNNAGVLASGRPLGLGGGTLRLKGQTGAGASSQTLSDLAITAGAGGSRIVIDPNGGGGTTLTLGNNWTRATGAVLNVDLSAAGTATLASSPALTGGILPYATVKDATGAGFATVSGGNAVRYAAGSELRSNSDAAGTDFTTKATDTDYVAGTLTMTNASRALNSLSIDSSAGAGAIDLGAAAISTVALGPGTNLTFGSGATYNLGALGDSGNVDTGTAAVTVNVGSNGADTSLSGILSGTGTFIKRSFGTWTLSGANTFSGQLSVKAGAVAIATINGQGADGPLGNSANSVALGDTDGSTGTLQFTGSTVVNTGLNVGSNKKITLAAGGSGTIQVDASTTNLTLSGLIDGGGNLNKTGAGTLTLSGLNTFGGQLRIKAGTLSTATVNDASADGPLGNSANAVVLGDSGTTGALRYTGATAASTKQISLAASGTGAIQIDNAGTVLTLSGGIGGGGSLSKTGAGTLFLTTVGGSYSGGATVGNRDAVFSFDAGTLGIRTLNMAVKSSSGNMTAGTAIKATMNLGGGTVNIGTGSGTAITLATQTGSGTNCAVEATLNITGTANVTVTGNIIDGNSTTGTTTSRLNLDGGVLDMTGKNLGGAGGNAIDVLTLASGALRNVGQINGGGNITKTTAGTLVVGGTNNFTGATLISAGTLKLDADGTINSTSGITVNGADARFITTSTTAVAPAATRSTTRRSCTTRPSCGRLPTWDTRAT